MHTSISYKISDFIFSIIIGTLIEFLRYAVVILFSPLFFICALITYARIKNDNAIVNSEKEQTKDKKDKEKPRVVDGFRLLIENKPFLITTITGAVINFFFSGFAIYILLFANYHDSPLLLGIANSVVAFGAFLGSILLVKYVFKNIGLGKKYCLGTIGFGIGLTVASFFTDTWHFIIILGIASLFLGSNHVTATPIFQTLADKKHFGKIMSASYTLSIGSMPLGALFFGIFTQNISIQMFFIAFGCVYIIIGLIYYFTKPIREIVL